MKNIVFAFFSLMLFIVTGCLKDEAPVDFGGITPTIEIKESGIQFFDSAEIDFPEREEGLPPDTIKFKFTVNLASEFPLDEDLTVQLGVDNGALSELNAQGGVQYTLYPEGTYIFENKTLTIPAGSRTADFDIIFFDSSILLSNTSYMLPISILDAEGIAVSGNFGTVFFHSIGVCIAGDYNVVGTRKSYTGPASDSIVSPIVVIIENIAPVKKMKAVTADTVEVAYGDLGSTGWAYIIAFDCDTDEIVGIGPNERMRQNILLNSFIVYDARYDADLKQFYLKTGYKNSSRNERIVEETFTAQ